MAKRGRNDPGRFLANGVVLPGITEREFLSQVIQLARACGWRVLHIRPGRTARGWATNIQGDGVGFPDLFGVHQVKGLRFVAELKVGRNKPTSEQKRWLQACEAAGIPAYTWRPEEFETEIREVLEARNHAGEKV